jgi:hypothetical protein
MEGRSMTWSFTLLGALLLLLPGLAGYAGLVAGMRHELVASAPERPNSYAALFSVLGFALIAHTLGAALFWFQAAYCQAAFPCHHVPYDPNPYKALLSTDHRIAAADGAVLGVLLGLMLLCVTSFIIGRVLGGNQTLGDIALPSGARWLRRIADDARSPDKVVLAYVLTTSGDRGTYAGYEGIVLHLSPGEDNEVALAVLGTVDRFVVTIDKDGIRRTTVEAEKMQTVQIHREQIANISFQTIPLLPQAPA